MRRTLTFLLTGALLCLCMGCGGACASYEDEAQMAEQRNTYNLTAVQQAIDSGSFAANVTFEGMDTLWGYDAPADRQIQITHQLRTRTGRAKLVLVTPDGRCTTIVENADHSEPQALCTTTANIQAGYNRIRLVADGDAQIELQLQIDCGNFVPLGM